MCRLTRPAPNVSGTDANPRSLHASARHLAFPGPQLELRCVSLVGVRPPAPRNPTVTSPPHDVAAGSPCRRPSVISSALSGYPDVREHARAAAPLLLDRRVPSRRRRPRANLSLGAAAAAGAHIKEGDPCVEFSLSHRAVRACRAVLGGAQEPGPVRRAGRRVCRDLNTATASNWKPAGIGLARPSASSSTGRRMVHSRRSRT